MALPVGELIRRAPQPTTCNHRGEPVWSELRRNSMGETRWWMINKEGPYAEHAHWTTCPNYAVRHG